MKKTVKERLQWLRDNDKNELCDSIESAIYGYVFVCCNNYTDLETIQHEYLNDLNVPE